MAQAGSVPDDRDHRAEATGAGQDEFLDDGRRSAPRWLRPSRRDRQPSRWWRAGYALVALAVVIALVRAVASTDSGRVARTSPRISTPPPATVVTGPVAIAALPGPVESVRGIAERAPKPADLVRQDAPAGQCAIVKPGMVPTTSVLRAARAALGPITLVDAQRTLDGATGLCALTIRARLPHVTIVVSVASPGSEHSTSKLVLHTGIAGSGALLTEYATAHTRGGWDVLVGAIGSRAALPDRQSLLRLAVADGVTW